jgi:hypothetical protein
LFPVIAELSPLPLLKFSILLSLISELMVTYLDDRMVNTHNRWAGAKDAQGNGNSPPPSTLTQAIASISESRDEQTELLWQLVAISARGGNGARNAPTPALTTNSDFVATHPLIFTEAREPLEVDHWLHAIESKFGFLRCTEVQKTLFTAQQLRGDASAWWANYTVTCPTDYQESWTEFRSAFRAHYIPAIQPPGAVFMDLKQGGRSVHDYLKLFSHLVQYAPDQVDTDDKKKDCFLIGLSMKL